MPIATLPDVDLHYEWAGSERAPVLMFSNSLGTNYRMWDAQIADFAPYFRILRYDTRGHGQSSVTAGPYSIEQLGQDTLKLLDYLQLSQVSFSGLSMGGMIGMFLGKHAPQRCKKLVLCNTAAKLGTVESWNARILAVELGGMKAVASTVIQRWFTSAFRDAYPAEVSRMRAMLETANPAGYVANCAAVRDADFRNDLRNIPLNTMVIAGSHDPVFPTADAEALADNIPGAQYRTVPASHISNIEAAGEFNRTVLQFLQS